jgi:hypothetical protein
LTVILAVRIAMSDIFTYQPIESASLAAVGYARQSLVLEIVFRSGAVYRYSEVPTHTYVQLLAADSKGRYFVQSIKGRYPYTKTANAAPKK